MIVRVILAQRGRGRNPEDRDPEGPWALSPRTGIAQGVDMKHKPHLSDVMTRDPQTVHLGQPLSEAYALLQKGEYHHVPVMDGDRPVGMISSTDILKLVYDVDHNDDRMLRTMLDHQFTLEDAMSTELVTVRNGESVRKVANHMSTGDNHSVIVVDDAGALEGIVTSSDLIRQLAELL